MIKLKLPPDILELIDKNRDKIDKDDNITKYKNDNEIIITSNMCVLEAILVDIINSINGYYPEGYELLKYFNLTFDRDDLKLSILSNYYLSREDDDLFEELLTEFRSLDDTTDFSSFVKGKLMNKMDIYTTHLADDPEFNSLINTEYRTWYDFARVFNLQSHEEDTRGQYVFSDTALFLVYLFKRKTLDGIEENSSMKFLKKKMTKKIDTVTFEEFEGFVNELQIFNMDRTRYIEQLKDFDIYNVASNSGRLLNKPDLLASNPLSKTILQKYYQIEQSLKFKQLVEISLLRMKLMRKKDIKQDVAEVFYNNLFKLIHSTDCLHALLILKRLNELNIKKKKIDELMFNVEDLSSYLTKIHGELTETSDEINGSFNDSNNQIITQSFQFAQEFLCGNNEVCHTKEFSNAFRYVIKMYDKYIHSNQELEIIQSHLDATSMLDNV